MLAVSSQLIIVITASTGWPGPGAPGPGSRRTAAAASTGPFIGFSLAPGPGAGGGSVPARARPAIARGGPPRPGIAPRLLASSSVEDQIYLGNANVDAPADRGWLLGHFKPAADLRHSEDVEIKWGIYAPGDRRAQWVTDEKR